MGVFSRFMDIVNANINSLLDKAEDPEKMVRLMIQEMEDTLIELKSACADKIAKKAKVDRERTELEALVERWKNRAEMALSKGRDDLAREALIEKRKAQGDLERKLEDWDRYEDIIAKSKEDIGKLEDKLQSLRHRHQSIVERATRAREEQAANETIRKASDAAATSRFDHMEQQVDRMEANSQMNKPKSNLESKFADLEELDEIEAELEQLRKKRQSR
ncbi:PspA/IM30 family protein [Pleomorphochaeta sp. DL1XJH-081]|uniref:PspA/IM30 family protein n=1 Tax=Pleomorphochaeta sp. DL1XJH-081 TaxID=3409690 RepID=UPI003BB7D321